MEAFVHKKNPKEKKTKPVETIAKAKQKEVIAKQSDAKILLKEVNENKSNKPLVCKIFNDAALYAESLSGTRVLRALGLNQVGSHQERLCE